MSLGSATSVDEAEQLADYRSVSALAVTALVFGLASPLAVLAPLLIALPLFGFAISLMAIRRLKASEGRLVGWPAALIGLSLSTMSVSAVFGYQQASSWLVSTQARVFGKHWLEIVLAGDMTTAFYLTAAGQQPARQSNDTVPLAEQEEDPRSPLEIFTDSPEIQTLSEIGQQGNVRYRETLSCVHLPSQGYWVTQVMEVKGGGTAAPDRVVPLELTIHRRSHRTRDISATWRIEDFRVGESVAPPET